MPPKEFEEYTIMCGIGNEEKITYVATSESFSSVSASDFPFDGGRTLKVSDGDCATISISDINANCTITGLYEPRPRRLRCEYCGCVSGRDFGTCEHCGAPLVPMEYYI